MQILYHLYDMLQCAGYPIVEDQFCSRAVEFWMTYTECLTNSLFTDQERPAFMDRALKLLPLVLSACWSKIQMPPHEISAAWDSDDIAKWNSFRSDVEDLLQSSYILLGPEFLGNLVRMALQSLEDRSWVPLEATLFFLIALSDTVSSEEYVDKALSALFESSLFVDMSSKTEDVPRKARQTVCDLITRYTAWIEQHGEYLPAMLNFLFEYLKEGRSATTAAKAIASTCSSCRRALVPEVFPFLVQYEAVLSWGTTDSYTKQKVIGGIAAIIQAIPSTSEEERFEPLSWLITSLEKDVKACGIIMETATAGSQEVEEALRIGTCVLRCLSSMGKGLQIPDDAPVDLDADDSIVTRFWRVGNGALLQERVLYIYRTLSGLMKWHGDIIEALCDILRTGYKESQLGLFVFRPVRDFSDFSYSIYAESRDIIREHFVSETCPKTQTLSNTQC